MLAMRGVAVSVIGTETRTVTDERGWFAMDRPPEGDRLRAVVLGHRHSDVVLPESGGAFVYLPLDPHPLFSSFIEASVRQSRLV